MINAVADIVVAKAVKTFTKAVETRDKAEAEFEAKAIAVRAINPEADDDDIPPPPTGTVSPSIAKSFSKILANKDSPEFLLFAMSNANEKVDYANIDVINAEKALGKAKYFYHITEVAAEAKANKIFSDAQ